MADAYALVGTVPRVVDCLRLRGESGLTPRTEEQARLALTGTWAACHIVHGASGQTVAMGRIIGDGGWYFHVVDVAVLPAHQRRGLGNRVRTWLLDQMDDRVPAGAFVSLMADPPGRGFYRRHGFTEDREASVAMARWL
jgi:ribosomal protein S18 acetylase RimI-like enzyme